MFIIKYYLGGAIASLALAILLPHWYFSFVFIWLAISLLIVSIAYIFDVPGVFRKQMDGSIPFYIMWLLLPFFLGVQLYNSWARRNDSVPAIQEIAPNLFLGCRLFPSDIDHLTNSGVCAILDATSEFSGLNWSAHDSNLAYLNVPILDHSSPHREDLNEAVNWMSHHIDNGRGVVVHCALGRGRSVLIVAAYLLASGKFDSVDEALSFINKIRGTAQLNDGQYKKLCKLHKQNAWQKKSAVLIIANPVSGGGKWQQYKDEIEQRLSRQYKLDCELTTKSTTAKDIALANRHKNYVMIIACGGDGTVNEVASALIDTQTVMAIIPLGTTNALAHVLMGNKSKLNPVEVACDDILSGDSRALDTAICNDDIFLLLAGIGFEQQMIASADRQNKDEAGELAYLEGLSAAFGQNEAREYDITIDDNAPQKINASSIVVANAAPFSTILAQGSGAPNPTDGKLDLTILDTQDSLAIPLLSLVSRGINGRVDQNAETDGIQSRHLEKIKIESDGPIDYAIDGEIRQAKTINIRINSKSLQVAHKQQV